jgi:hypothetical protein
MASVAPSMMGMVSASALESWRARSLHPRYGPHSNFAWGCFRYFCPGPAGHRRRGAMPGLAGRRRAPDDSPWPCRMRLFAYSFRGRSLIHSLRYCRAATYVRGRQKAMG